MSQQIEILESVLCDLCSNVSRGVKANGQRICFDCADAELVREIVLVIRPDLVPLERSIREAGIT